MAIPIWVLPVITAAGSILKKLINSDANSDSMGALQGGFDQAAKTINDATAKSFEYLDPYLKGGREDYDRYRRLSNGGYYDTPYSGTAQPQAFQNQGVEPGESSREIMSFKSNYQPMQFRPMGLLSSPQLPALPPMQIAQAPTPGPQQMSRPNALPGMSIEGMMMDAANNYPRNLPGEVPRGMPISPMDEVINRGKPPDPSKPFQLPGPITMKEWLEQNSSTQPGSLPYKGSGPYMPTFNYMQSGRRA